MTDHRPEQTFCFTREDAQRAWAYLSHFAAIGFEMPATDWHIVREANAHLDRECYERTLIEDSPSEKLEILAELERLRTRRPSCMAILKDIA